MPKKYVSRDELITPPGPANVPSTQSSGDLPDDVREALEDALQALEDSEDDLTPAAEELKGSIEKVLNGTDKDVIEGGRKKAFGALISSSKKFLEEDSEDVEELEDIKDSISTYVMPLLRTMYKLTSDESTTTSLSEDRDMAMTRYVDVLQCGVDEPGTIVVHTLGKWTDPRYGSFQMTDEMLDQMIKNFNGRVKHPNAPVDSQVPIDARHLTEAGAGAVGWVTKLGKKNGKLLATVKWTGEGEKLVSEGVFKYVSPKYTEHFKRKDGDQAADVGTTLLEVALTNNPVLSELPPINGPILLSRDAADEYIHDQILVADEPNFIEELALSDDEVYDGDLFDENGDVIVDEDEDIELSEDEVTEGDIFDEEGNLLTEDEEYEEEEMQFSEDEVYDGDIFDEDGNLLVDSNDYDNMALSEDEVYDGDLFDENGVLLVDEEDFELSEEEDLEGGDTVAEYIRLQTADGQEVDFTAERALELMDTVGRLQRERHEASVDGVLKKAESRGVPPAMTRIARSLLLRCDAGAANTISLEREDEPVNVYGAIVKLLEAAPTVSLSERSYSLTSGKSPLAPIEEEIKTLEDAEKYGLSRWKALGVVAEETPEI